MSLSSSVPVTLKSRTEHTATIIFLHGLGDNGASWTEILDRIIPDYVKIICPNAPSIPVSMYENSIMPSWYDISKNEIEDLESLENSSKHLQNIIDNEVNNLPNGGNSRIMIGGFSQGGAIAINNLLKSNQTLAGCLILSSYFAGDVTPKFDHKIETPVFHCHGRADQVISKDKTDRTLKVLKEVIQKYEFHNMPNLGHEINDEELDLIKDFIYDNLPPVQTL